MLRLISTSDLPNFATNQAVKLAREISSPRDKVRPRIFRLFPVRSLSKFDTFLNKVVMFDMLRAEEAKRRSFSYLSWDRVAFEATSSMLEFAFLLFQRSLRFLSVAIESSEHETLFSFGSCE